MRPSRDQMPIPFRLDAHRFFNETFKRPSRDQMPVPLRLDPPYPLVSKVSLLMGCPYLWDWMPVGFSTRPSRDRMPVPFRLDARRFFDETFKRPDAHTFE